jgi:hypothetical protein
MKIRMSTKPKKLQFRRNYGWYEKVRLDRPPSFFSCSSMSRRLIARSVEILDTPSMREICGKHFPVISPLGVAAVAGAEHPRTSTKTRVSTKPKLQFFFSGFSNTGIRRKLFLTSQGGTKNENKRAMPLSTGYFFLNWGMRSLTSFPTISTRCSSSALVSALKTGRLTRFSSIHSRANSPSWISRRISCMAT